MYNLHMYSYTGHIHVQIVQLLIYLFFDLLHVYCTQLLVMLPKVSANVLNTIKEYIN